MADQVSERKLKEYKTLLLKKKKRGLEDLYFFNKFVLESNEKRRNLLVPHVHGEWWDWFKKSKSRIKCILVPRNSFKSTFFTVGYTLQQICQDRDARILIANATLPNSQKFLSEIKMHLQKNDILKQLYGKFYDKDLTWNQDEVEVLGRSMGTREPTVSAIGAEGNLVSRHYSHIIADDLVNRENSATKYQAEKIIDWWKRSLSLLEPDGEMLIIGCLTGDSDVLMADGTWKKIVDVEPGEEVWSVDTDNAKRSPLVKKRVERMIPQGMADVYRVKTKRHSLDCTGNHPFLTFAECPCCGTKNGKLIWKKAEDLEKGEFVLTSKQVQTGYRKKIWNNKFATKDFYWLFGFLMGDGWVTRAGKRTAVCACYGEDEKINKKVRRLMKKYFGNVYKTDFGYYRVDTVKGRDIEKWGIQGGAKGKRIPRWIFKSRPNLKRAFLRGLIDADGYEQVKGDAFRIELTNKELIENVHKLSLTCSVRPTSIYHRKRTIQPPNSPEPVESETWSVGLVFKHWQEKENKTACETPFELLGLRMERIESVENTGTEEVYDLTIEDTHNFISNGYVVHNTRWSYYELYSYLIENYEDKIDFFVRSIYNPDGSMYFPERFNADKVQELKDFHGSYIFSAFYLNDPVDDETALIKKSMIKEYKEGDQPNNLNIFAMCDPAVAQTADSDYSAIVVVGEDDNRNWWVRETRRGRWSVNKLIEQLFDVYREWRPHSMTIETIGQAQSILQPIHDAEIDRNVFLPLVAIKARNAIQKETRIRSVLQPRFERGKVYILPHMNDLREELLKFPKSAHDDLIDALTDCSEVCFNPPSPEENNPKPGSYFESQLKENFNKNTSYYDETLGEYF